LARNGGVLRGLDRCNSAVMRRFVTMPELIPVLTSEEIERSVATVADRISADYRNREVILVGVLKGAFVFLSDLIRQLSIPIKVDFVRIASYGNGTSSSGSVALTKPLEIDISGKDVLVIEDIVDTGITLRWLTDHLSGLGPSSVKVCTLIDKKERRRSDVRVDYACNVVDKGFLVGYGLDYAEDYRYLPAVYHLKM
jgi:hypoxanthine phosphoribosyltransferase